MKRSEEIKLEREEEDMGSLLFKKMKIATEEDDIKPNTASFLDDINSNHFNMKANTRDEEYFNMVIKPMLSAGHEGELCQWLKGMSLLSQSMKCHNESCGSSLQMQWQKARNNDKYSWVCSVCMKKQSIRTGSFFMNLKSEIKVIIKIIRAWCQNSTISSVSKNLELKDFIVKNVYSKCSQVASQYVMDHSNEWILGVEGDIVIIDVFPEGYMVPLDPRTSHDNHEIRPDHRSKKCITKRKILCLAEISQIPPKIYAVPLSKFEESSNSPISDEIIALIKQYVKPGTLIVANEKAKCCFYDQLKELKDYPSIISVETLMKFDSPETPRLSNNLKTIWQSLTHTCELIQDIPEKNWFRALNEFMWRQKFVNPYSSALESILHHITEQYIFID